MPCRSPGAPFTGGRGSGAEPGRPRAGAQKVEERADPRYAAEVGAVEREHRDLVGAPVRQKPPQAPGGHLAGHEPLGQERDAEAGERRLAQREDDVRAERRAWLDARTAIPIPDGMPFAEATTLPIQGLSAYALLKLAARPRRGESVLVQAAAGGVGLYLVQLAKRLGFERVIALASSRDKLDLVSGLGADATVDYAEAGWPERVREATGGRGVDVVLEMSGGDVAQACLELVAPFGRVVVYGARNMYDSLSPEQLTRLIRGNQSLVFFNVPTQRPESLSACIPDLLALVAQGKVRAYARERFPLADARRAFEALASRRTIGKLVLVP